MYWYGTSESDRILADEWFFINMNELIDSGKQWGWLVWLRRMLADKYYLVVNRLGGGEFDKKQRIKKEAPLFWAEFPQWCKRRNNE